MKLTFERDSWPQLLADVQAFLSGVHGPASPSPVPAEEPQETNSAEDQSESTDAGGSVPGRRGRRSRASSTPAPAPSETPTGRRAGRAVSAAKEPASAPKKALKDYSDLDLARAASDAAPVIKPAGVKKVLEEFGVRDVSKLEGAQRKEFVERLAAQKKAGAGA